MLMLLMLMLALLWLQRATHAYQTCHGVIQTSSIQYHVGSQGATRRTRHAVGTALSPPSTTRPSTTQRPRSAARTTRTSTSWSGPTSRTWPRWSTAVRRRLEVFGRPTWWIRTTPTPTVVTFMSVQDQPNAERNSNCLTLLVDVSGKCSDH